MISSETAVSGFRAIEDLTRPPSSQSIAEDEEVIEDEETSRLEEMAPVEEEDESVAELAGRVFAEGADDVVGGTVPKTTSARE